MKNTYQRAAEQLLNNRIRQPQKVRLATKIRPQDCEQALHVQAEIIKLRSDEITGWKCLLPLDKDKLVVAPIFSNTVQSGEQCSLFSENEKARIEPEIAFILGTDLPATKGGYSHAKIDRAVKSCHMALELIQDRFSEKSEISFCEKLADCLANQGLFIGPEIDKCDAYSASKFNITIDQNEKNQFFNGQHPNQLPQKPLYWLINFMTKRGISFTAGQAIITGSYAGVVEVEFNHSTTIEYNGLGKYQVTFII
jgi:2-keto-4-pentenoate hydratase